MGLYYINDVRKALKEARIKGHENISSEKDLLDLLSKKDSNGYKCSKLSILLFLQQLRFDTKSYENEKYDWYLNFIRNNIYLTNDISKSKSIFTRKTFTVNQIKSALKEIGLFSYSSINSKEDLLQIFNASYTSTTKLKNFLEKLGFKFDSDYVGGREHYRMIIRENIEIIDDNNDINSNNSEIVDKWEFSVEEIQRALQNSGFYGYLEITTKDSLLELINDRKFYIGNYIYNVDNIKKFIDCLNPDILLDAEKNSTDREELVSIIKNRIVIKDEKSTETKELPDIMIENDLDRYKILTKSGKLIILKPSEYQTSTNNKFYYKITNDEKLAVDVTHTDNIWLQFNKEIKDLFVLCRIDVDNEKFETLAYGTFLKKDGKYYLELSSKNNHIDFSSNNRAYKIIFFDENDERYAVDFEASCEEMPDDEEHVLCIDFGTSNTSVGTWDELRKDNKIILVDFDDFTVSNSLKISNLLPTVAYIQHADLEKKEYTMLFGYEALRELKIKDYDPKGSMFLNIKQWLSANDDFEVECKDEDDHFFKLKAKEIIAYYLKYVVNLSEIKLKRHFVKLHFSAPVKLKSKFNDLVSCIFNKENGYEVVGASESLDEGLAIIYNYISNEGVKFEENSEKNENDREGKVMVIDCGGGTTDIARCEYKFNEADTGLEAKIKTKFENGFNFGGNDLTYLIFQLLKIKLSDFYQHNTNDNSSNVKIAIGDFFNKKGDDYLEEIDKCVKNPKKQNEFNIYDKLKEASSKAEWILPTDFNNKRYVDGNENIRKARRNIIYLWDLAEKIKIKFFTNYDLASLRFNEVEEFKTDKSLYFYIDITGNESNSKLDLIESKGVPNIEINNKELAILLSPQIYYTLSLVIPDSDELLLNGTEIYLSGQSSKINLFKDLLKEFIPGRRTRCCTNNTSNLIDKKLDCVKGCIQYLMDKEYGALNSELIVETPNIPFKIYTNEGIGNYNQVLFDGNSLKMENDKLIMARIPIVRRPLNKGSIILVVNNTSYTSDTNEYETTVKLRNVINEQNKLIDLSNLMERIKKDSLNNIDNYYCEDNNEEKLLERLKIDLNEIESDSKGKLLVFAVPNNDGCGFILYQIAKLEDSGSMTYYLTAEEKLYYQKVETFKSIFDGCNCK